MFVFRQLVTKLPGLKIAKNSTIFPILRAFSSNNSFLDSGVPDVEIPNLTIPELLLNSCEKYENFIALECGVTGRKYTYGDLQKKSKNLCQSLRKHLKLKEGDVIGILLPNIPEFPVVVFGALRAGLVVTTVNPIYTKEEISRQLSDASVKALVTLNEFWDTASSSAKLLKLQIPIVVIKSVDQSLPDGAIDYRQLADCDDLDLPALASGHPAEVALLPYSSGTTGLPKGVRLSHGNIVANITQIVQSGLNGSMPTTESHQDVLPAVLPMFHIYGLSINTIFALSQGFKVVTLPKFTPEYYISVLKNHKPHCLLLVPPIVLFLTTSAVKSEYLQSVRSIMCGAAPLGALDEEKLLQKAGKHIDCLQGYGLTETSPLVAGTSVKLKSEVKNIAGSIGRPVVNTLVKVVKPDDPNMTHLGPNESGELLVKGPQVMLGYLNRPEDTSNSIVGDGWLRTGDMVHYNEDGVIYVTDRLKELIKVKGFQVPPAELEEIIRDFPGVGDAAVIGIPHPKYGEVPRAYVVPKPNTKLDPKRIAEYLAKKVAEYKQLAGGVALVDSIPKNATGKIIRRDLKEQYLKSIGTAPDV